MFRKVFIVIFLAVSQLSLAGPIHDSAGSGDLPKLKDFLRTAPEFLNTKDEHGNTALHYAVKNGHEDVVKYLLFLRADANQINKSGETPLTVLANANLAPERTQNLLQHLISGGGRLNFQGPQGESLIISATQKKWANIIITLLNSGCNPNIVDQFGNIPVLVAAQNNDLDTLKLLRQGGGKINVANERDETPLHFAVKNDNLDMVKYLLESGANKDVQNANGQSAFDLMATSKNFQDYAELVRVIEGTVKREMEVNKIQFKPSVIESEVIIKRVAIQEVPMPAPATPTHPRREEKNDDNDGWQKAVIQDKDGYTNMRSSASKNSNIIRKIMDGEVFLTTPTSSDWWQVKTPEGIVGFVHKSRIRILK